MRILHVTPSFYPAWAYGGIPRCAYEVCRSLAARGDEVTVWTTDAFDAVRLQKADPCVALADAVKKDQALYDEFWAKNK